MKKYLHQTEHFRKGIKIETTGNDVEITIPGDFPGMVERIITYPGGSIVYEDENRIYIKY